MIQPRCVVVFAGSSGGHLFPALAFGEVFREKYPESTVILVSGQKAKRFSSCLNPQVFGEVFYLPEFPLPTGFSWGAVLFIFKLLQGFMISLRFLLKHKPDLCVGFGSYVAYPGIMLSSMLRIPVIIHEQNRFMGKATRHLLCFSDFVGVTFNETLDDIKKSVRKVMVGLPIRSALRSKANQMRKQLPTGIFQILVVGGSQGAHRLNEIVIDAFSCFTPEEKQQIAVIHITGKDDWPWVMRRYRSLQIQSEIYPFYENMELIYPKADLAITRCGANTLFELALFRIPAIVVPYPLAEKHQLENSKVFALHHAVILREENSLNGATLADLVRQMKRDDRQLQDLSDNIGKMEDPNAADRLVTLAEEIMEEYQR
ncbi:MAG: UDP-N-acetylglucosamine--N-acetylmuramyl-(pentapeptide) pyrophosphoryl-undecaprenol N-acetylglucosamine transferase [Candidatus Omnitrophica bacterium]|nr:UDP-N-acetylglucosamine--N-acetylmuramyl-(pentapeptide) pyrophosphoryl-undecaprenol N-acetylglucosamine transferase [Candidatus Omnitrophota bacterium]MDD5670436.1 UDP-N-acetylglucosamine--N-acetylmuramyl-(pentapeptide) pyrophosphoryl-undecaprenol N-acetylglucosamine transferase [Candidatus Omnitrophota bacterium]